ncbi:hypothetical protein [Roseibium sp.]|uniref:hypothetical protein n=1 Tax=Roseibium sp. TaxID=1936156 RepID=UPI003D0D9D53
MTRNVDLKSDCANCAALCCVVFAFDKSESFALDKKAGEACPNLTGAGKCSVFEDREKLGFKGCIAYDCFGAGQRVTQEVFKGKSWKDDIRLMTGMGEALSVLRRIHEQLVLLESAAKLPLTREERNRLRDLQATLAPEADWTQANLNAFPLETNIKEVATFLQGLRHHMERNH